MYSGEEMELGGTEVEVSIFEELGLGDEFMFHPSEFNITGEDLMLSSALTLSDLEANSVVEPLTENGEKERLAELRPMDFEYGDSFESAFGLNDVPLDVGNEVVLGLEMEDLGLQMEDVKFAVDTEIPWTSKMEDVKFEANSQIPGTSKMEDVKFTVTSETPGTSKMEDVKVRVTRRSRRNSKMEDGKLAETNQSTKAAKVVVGVKGRGRGRRGTGKATKAKDEIAEVLHLRPPRKLKHRVSQHVPEERKTAEYYEHRRKNTEAARKCREKKRGVDEKRVEIIKRQDEKIKELEAKVASLERDNKIYQDVIAKLGQSAAIPQGVQGHRRLPKKTHHRK